jgi:hypothetical protein
MTPATGQTERCKTALSWEKACALAHGLGIPIANLSAHAKSTARIRQDTEDILEQERTLLARQPPDWAP